MLFDIVHRGRDERHRTDQPCRRVWYVFSFEGAVTTDTNGHRTEHHSARAVLLEEGTSEVVSELGGQREHVDQGARGHPSLEPLFSFIYPASC